MEEMEENHGIEPAGDSDKEGLSPGEQSMLADAFFDFLGQITHGESMKDEV